MRMKNTIAVVCTVDWPMSASTGRDRRPRAAANASAPRAPTPAASVGVAKPPRMEPSTATMSRIGGAKLRASSSARAPARARSRRAAGARAGFLSVAMTM